MFLANLERIMAQIRPTDIVLEIGGWAQPFRRANFIMDAFPYETRGWYSTIGLPACVGEGEEHFTKDTWIQRDACSRDPFPFEDKSIDYVICSHILEDVRDPLWVCSEMIRVGKRGYIEVPSRVAESIVNPKTRIVGAVHHRWLVTIGSNGIVFEMKYHLIHKKGLHLPHYVLGLLRPEQGVQWLFWEGSFEFEEATIPLGEEDIEQRLHEFVKANAPTVPITYRLFWRSRQLLSPLKGLVPKPLAEKIAGHWRYFKNISIGTTRL